MSQQREALPQENQGRCKAEVLKISPKVIVEDNDLISQGLGVIAIRRVVLLLTAQINTPHIKSIARHCDDRLSRMKSEMMIAPSHKLAFLFRINDDFHISFC
nr:hypothetical protein Itr_chr11CG15530 [Ipomoea trifida]